jgi:predicted transposase YdaD
MMQFDLMETRAGQDIFLIGKNEGKLEGIEEGKLEGKLEGIQEGKLEGIQEGKLEGKSEEKQEIALSMLSRGLSVELIADITHLSEQEILALQTQLPPTVH